MLWVGWHGVGMGPNFNRGRDGRTLSSLIELIKVLSKRLITSGNLH